ncbi:MAG: DUF2007 domain-containing protein [Robiginitomaculum sp.]
MKVIIKTNNPVTLSYARSVLKDVDIDSFIMDTHQSILVGALGIVLQRIMVIDEDYVEARRVLIDAGLKGELWRR